MTLGNKHFEIIVGKGEKAGNSIFYFSHYVFNPVQLKLGHLSHIEIVVCKCFQFGHG